MEVSTVLYARLRQGSDVLRP